MCIFGRQPLRGPMMSTPAVHPPVWCSLHWNSTVLCDHQHMERRKKRPLWPLVTKDLSHLLVTFILLLCPFVCCCYCLVVSNSFVTPWTIAHQAPLSMGFPRQEYWSRLTFPSLGHLPDSGIEPVAPVSPALIGRFFTAEPPGKPPAYNFSVWSNSFQNL